MRSRLGRAVPAAARIGCIAALVAGVAGTGCGYRVAGQADLMPKTVRTIAVPAFVSGTTRYKLARLLPADIAHELLSRTRYVIVPDRDQADAVIEGALANFTAFPIVSDPKTGRATAAQVVVTLDLTLRERVTGKVLWSQKGAEYKERYEIALDPQAYFDESGAAAERVSRDVARSVVSAILEGF